MKLTNQQVKALAKKIYKDINDKINEYNDSINNGVNFKEWLSKNKKYVDLINDFTKTYLRIKDCKELSDTMGYYFDRIDVSEKNIDTTLKYLFSKTLRLKKGVSLDAIENEIILATIEYDDLDSLTKSLYKKFNI